MGICLTTLKAIRFCDYMGGGCSFQLVFASWYYDFLKNFLPPTEPFDASERPRLPVPPPRLDPLGRPLLAPLGGCLRRDLPSIS